MPEKVRRSKTACFCLGCQYPLVGLQSMTCPECGRAFDPKNPATMQVGWEPGWFDRWWCSSLGWPIHALTVVVAVGSVQDSFDLPLPRETMMLVGMGWPVLWFYWLIRLMVRPALLGFYGPATKCLRGGWEQWAVLPLIFALSMACAWWIDF